CLVIFITCSTLSAPVLVNSLMARPQAAAYRLELLADSLETYRQHPVVGSGLAAVVIDARKRVDNKVRFRAIHNQYLVLLTEVGPLGLLIYYVFFWQIVRTAFRSMRGAE